MNRQHILEEIKRTAKENKGIPLGRARFFSETGIKASDWYGKHWVRWGDAVCEAGFTPNQRTKAYDEAMLIEKLVALTREIGHFPLWGDLRMKAGRDAHFPSHSTFDRLGSRSQKISKVVEYCRKRKGFEDVLLLCKEVPGLNEREVGPEPSENDWRSAGEIGSVYLLKSGKFYKIGRSNASGRRERELQIQLPEKANIAHTIRTDDPVGIEAYWHKRFEGQRKNGEWFALGTADVQAFKRRKFM